MAELKPTKRIFINSVDHYQGKSLGKYLGQCVPGASLEELDEEEEETGSVASGAEPPQKEGCFQVFGTLKDKDTLKPDFVQEIVKNETKEQLYDQLQDCDVIIYDITQDPEQIDEAVWAVSELHADLEKLEKPKMFILISSVMTWARSKPLDPDDPEIAFTEDDYRRRKPHPNFKEHISAEKTVIKLGKTNKNKLVTYVVSSGLTYGLGESLFHYLFKSAWHNEPELQCFGTGQNVIPTIHIRDLAGVLQNIIDSRPKVRYLVAVDDSNNTLEEIVKAVAQHLGTNKVRKITKEEALLSKDLEQADFDQLLVNLRMDAVFVKENMRIRWTGEAGLVESIETVVKEYKETRGLMPMRALIVGPPAVGKSTLAKALCEHYKLHHVRMKDVIDETIDNLTKSAARADQEDQEEDDGKAQEDAELLETINESKEQNDGRIEDQYIIRFFKEKLLSMPCQNQGFVLDGFPKTVEQAKELFAGDDEEEEEDGGKAYNKNIMPEVVISLEAPDQFLRNRVMNLPEIVVAGTHNTEEGLTRRLAYYHSVNTEDETVLNYFDNLEIHPEVIDVSKLDKTHDSKELQEKVRNIMGEPRNYGPTKEELEEIRRIAEEERLQREQEEKAERERLEEEEAAQRKQRQEEWADRLEQVKKEEYELLETQSVPLRNYLMEHVMPTLTQGLVDCCKVRPDDSIDYLAEYLFKNNPKVD